MAFAVALTFGAAPAGAADKKPNILLIVSDDHGYGDIGAYGGGGGARHANAQLGPHGGRRDDVFFVLRPAELHPGSGGHANRADTEPQRFDVISEPIHRGIGQLGAWRQEWLEERRRWNEWENSLVKEQEFDQLQRTFVKANDTIDTALNLILPQLKSMLEVQEKAGLIETKLEVLTAELDALVAKEHRSTLLDESPPMISFQFLSQFRSSKLWYRVQRDLDEISWPDSRFFARQGWSVLLQGFLSLFAIIAIYRNRGALNQTKRWRFIAARPLSAGLFLSFTTTLLIYEFQGAPAVWRLSNSIVAGITFARLIGVLIEASWIRQFVYGSTIVYIINRTFHVFNPPLPLYRLYLGITALVGLFFCLL